MASVLSAQPGLVVLGHTINVGVDIFDDLRKSVANLARLLKG